VVDPERQKNRDQVFSAPPSNNATKLTIVGIGEAELAAARSATLARALMKAHVGDVIESARLQDGDGEATHVGRGSKSPQNASPSVRIGDS
jgi:hypothetical protein